VPAAAAVLGAPEVSLRDAEDEDSMAKPALWLLRCQGLPRLRRNTRETWHTEQGRSQEEKHRDTRQSGRNTLETWHTEQRRGQEGSTRNRVWGREGLEGREGEIRFQPRGGCRGTGAQGWERAREGRERPEESVRGG